METMADAFPGCFSGYKLAVGLWGVGEGGEGRRAGGTPHAWPRPHFPSTPPQVSESHQRTKVDTSGTAKAVVASFNRMGLTFGEVCRRRYIRALFPGSSVARAWGCLVWVWVGSGVGGWLWGGPHNLPDTGVAIAATRTRACSPPTPTPPTPHPTPPKSDIELVRDPEQQVARMGVPESALDGHAFHTYTGEAYHSDADLAQRRAGCL